MRFLLLAAILCAGGWPQTATAQMNPVPVASEPQHHLIFQNEYARAYFVEVPAHQATLLHQHDLPYMAVALGPADIVNAVRGKPEVRLTLPDGQVLYSKGGFAHIARADTGLPFRNITVEFLHPQGEVQNLCTRVIPDNPAGDCPSYDPGLLEGPPPLASIKPLFETDEVKVLSGVLAGNGEWSDNKSDRPGRLLLALDQSTLSVEIPGRPAKILKTGEAMWLPVGATPMIRNLESLITSAFILIAFKDSIPKRAGEEKMPAAKSVRPASADFLAAGFSRLEQQDIVPFGIVEHGPGRPLFRAGKFGTDDALAAEIVDSASEIGNLEENHGLVARRVIFGTFPLDAQKPVSGVELRELARSFVKEFEAESLAVECFRGLEVVGVELDSYHAHPHFAGLGHRCLPRVSYAKSLTTLAAGSKLRLKSDRGGWS